MMALEIRSPPISDGSIELAKASGAEQTSRRSMIGNFLRRDSSVITSLKNDSPASASFCISGSGIFGL